MVTAPEDLILSKVGLAAKALTDNPATKTAAKN
jgi:hypothetical protein